MSFFKKTFPIRCCPSSVTRCGEGAIPESGYSCRDSQLRTSERITTKITPKRVKHLITSSDSTSKSTSKTKNTAKHKNCLRRGIKWINVKIIKPFRDVFKAKSKNNIKGDEETESNSSICSFLSMDHLVITRKPEYHRKPYSPRFPSPEHSYSDGLRDLSPIAILRHHSPQKHYSPKYKSYESIDTIRSSLESLDLTEIEYSMRSSISSLSNLFHSYSSSVDMSDHLSIRSSLSIPVITSNLLQNPNYQQQSPSFESEYSYSGLSSTGSVPLNVCSCECEESSAEIIDCIQQTDSVSHTQSYSITQNEQNLEESRRCKSSVHSTEECSSASNSKTNSNLNFPDSNIKIDISEEKDSICSVQISVSDVNSGKPSKAD